MSSRKSLVATGFVSIAALLLASCGSGSSASDDGEFRPEDPVTMIVPFSAGGGVDLAGRTISSILQEEEIVDVRMDVENVDGGSGLVGMSRLLGMDGADNGLMVTGAHILSTPLLSPEAGVEFSDFTPLATVYTEYVYLMVTPDSEISDIADLADRLKADPGSVSIGGSVPGGASNLGVAKFAQAIGVDPTQLTYVPYDGDEAIPAALGGKIDVVSTGPEGMDLVEAGELRALAVSSDAPLTGRDADVPTWADAGADDSFANFRIVSGPPNMSEEAVSYWKDALTAMSETEEWQDAMETNGWAPFFNTDGLEDYLAEQNSEYETLLSDLGITSG